MESLVFIEALGNILTTYRSDLIYIRDFHRYKNGTIPTKEYLQKSKGTFKSFVDEFRVSRNFAREETHTLLKISIAWTSSKNQDDVDGFADKLKNKGITHGKVMTSLASKILFLNDPWRILPFDNQAKRTLRLQGNHYSDYFPLKKEFTQKYKKEIKYYLSSINQHLSIIEGPFKNEIKNIKAIRLNRYVDKVLWTAGRNK